MPPSNSSTSPVKFLGALGAWFKAFAAKTGRTAPLMDGLDFHPYPVPQSLPFATGYPNANDASVSNLPRIYQAFYDGFNGIAAADDRPAARRRAAGQPQRDGHPDRRDRRCRATAGPEVSANAAGGMVGKYATEAYQASYYTQMLDLLACDPNVRVVNIFHLVDEPNLAGWQSGLYWVGTTAPVAEAVGARDQELDGRDRRRLPGHRQVRGGRQCRSCRARRRSSP